MNGEWLFLLLLKIGLLLFEDMMMMLWLVSSVVGLGVLGMVCRCLLWVRVLE